jgi:hypothetical protein
MQRRLAIAFVVATIAAMAVACSNTTNPSQNTVDNFQGTVQPANAGPIHPFNANNNGEFTVVFTALNPAPAAGVIFGQVAQNQCAGVVQVGAVGQAVFSSSINKGSYCVQVYDYVGVSVPFTYTLKVSHP